MKTFLLDIPDRFRRFDEQLDVKALLCNKSWQVFNDSGVKEIYIFQEDGSLIISLNGKVSRATWQYIPANRSLIINSDNESYMLRPFFQDENLFTLQLDGTQEFSFLINEIRKPFFPVNSLSDLKLYLKNKEQLQIQQQIEKEKQQIYQRIDNKQTELSKIQQAEKEKQQMLQIQQQAAEERRLMIQRREKERIERIKNERKKQLQSFIETSLSKDEHYLKMKQREDKYSAFPVLLSIITFFIAFLFNKYYITIILIGGILIISSIIYSNNSFKKRTKYEKNATKLLTEEFNRKYPEEDD